MITPDLREAVQTVATLFVSPSAKDHGTLRNIFLRSNWQLHCAWNLQEAVGIIRREAISVVICDDQLPDGNWKLLLHETDRVIQRPVLIVASRKVDEHLWGDVLRSGGYDLLAMPWSPRDVRKAVALAWRSWELSCRCSCSVPRQAGAATGVAQVADGFFVQ